MKNKLCKFAFLSFLFVIAGCGGPQTDYICHEGLVDRECKDYEIAMIDNMRAIINMVQEGPKNPVDTLFNKAGNTKDVRDAKILFFGEDHTDLKGQIENLQAINALLGPEDLVLLEGGNRADSLIVNCVEDLIFQILVTAYFNQKHQSYVPEYKADLARELSKIYLHTEQSYDFSGLNLRNIKCRSWDDETVKTNRATRKGLIPRNESMIMAIKENLPNYRKVAVMTGAAHLPSGDHSIGLFSNMENPDFPTEINQFYQIVEQELRRPKASRSYFVSHGIGSTKNIYEYLKKSGHTYIELIPRHLFYRQ